MGDPSEALGAQLLPGPPGSGGRLRVVPAAAEGQRLLAIGAPMIAEELLSYASTLVSLAYAGRLPVAPGGVHPLSAFALSHSLTNITGLALLNGVTSALDTVGSQAHGSRTFAAVGLALQRALLLSLAASVPLLGLYAAAGPVLRALGQQAAVAAAAARYTRLYAARIPLHAVVLCLYRTLASQGAAGYVLAGGAALFAVTPPLNHLLIHTLRMGLDGSALAAVASEAVYVSALTLLCWRHNSRQAPEARWWRGWDLRAALSGWGPYVRLSLAGTAMIVADWWAYDILTLLAGLLPNPELPLAATGILYNIQASVFMLPFGLAFALCARVGHHLGGRRPGSARLAADIGVTMGAGLAAVPAFLLLLLRHQAAALFSSDPAVVRLCGALMLPLVVCMISNGLTALLSAIMRGAGRQKFGAAVNAGCNYGLGLPLQCLLAFALHWGAAGLWWGIAAAATLQAVLLGAVVHRFNWQKESKRAALLVRHLSGAGWQQASPPAGDEGLGAAEGAEEEGEEVEEEEEEVPSPRRELDEAGAAGAGAAPPLL